MEGQNYIKKANGSYMRNYLKISSPWSQLALFMGLLAGSLFLTFFVSGVILLAKSGIGQGHPGLDALDPGTPGMTNLLKWLQGLDTILIFGTPAYLYARMVFREKSLYFLGFRPAGKSNFYLLAIAILLFAFPFEGWLGELNKSLPLPAWMIGLEKAADKQISAFLKADSVTDVIMNLVIVAILPAIFEEVCFRGVLQRILIRIFKSPWAGIVVTAIFFSAFHMQFQGFLPRMFLGVLLGAVYWYSGSLWASILAHFFVNGLQVVIISFHPKFIEESPSLPLYTVLISIIIVVGLLSILRRQSTITYKAVYETESTETYNEFIS
jgi:uncharacterized protein